jgi:hypothetical protein
MLAGIASQLSHHAYSMLMPPIPAVANVIMGAIRQHQQIEIRNTALMMNKSKFGAEPLAGVECSSTC